MAQQVAYHDELYYRRASPEISDFEYDCLKSELQYLQSKHPDWKIAEEKVGDDRIEGFVTLPHREPMLSLANTYNQTELFEFDKRSRKNLQFNALEYVIEPKIDGVAVSVTYEKGQLVRALTRGNGIEGDDITHNIDTIVGLPQSLKGDNIPPFIEIRGEIFINNQDFLRINLEREEEGLEPYANPRNLAAGTVKLLDSQKASERNLKIIFYDIGYCEPTAEDLFKTQENVHNVIEKWGLPHQEKFWKAFNINEVWSYIQELDFIRKTFSYGTDGAVVKIDNLFLRKTIGATSKVPLGAIAYKFAPERSETMLKGITIQVGRTGVLTPVAELEPVTNSGSLISRATLHNADEIARLDVRVGDTVLIEKAGEVIPAIVGVLRDKRLPTSAPYPFPTKCPACGSPVVRLPEEVAWRCPDASCPPQVRRRILHFSSKQAMDINNLGVSIVDQLVTRGLVSNIADLYNLKIEDFFLLDKVADKSAKNLYDSIQASKNNELWRLLHGLGIQHIGAQSAKELANFFKNIDSLCNASMETLMQASGIGETVAKSIRAFFENTDNLHILNQLRSSGVCMDRVETLAEASSPIKGKKFVITGMFPNLPREELKRMIESVGGLTVDTVTKKTDYLIVGSDPGSKVQKAQELGIPTLSLQEFISLKDTHIT